MSEREPNRKDSRSKPISAVLDERHHGDIHGAFGTIRLSDVTPRRTWRRRLLTLAAIVGPGLIVMVGDNDAGGVSTYAQAGHSFFSKVDGWQGWLARMPSPMAVGYEEDAAEDGWQRMLAFFDEHVRG